MKTPKKKFPFTLFVIVVLMVASFSLTACASSAPENNLDTVEDQQTEIIIPIVGSDVEENSETLAEDKAYPVSEQESHIAESSQDEAYPEPEVDTLAEVDSDSSTGEAYPAPQEETEEMLKPTPRGNDLVATNPASVNLASGQLQLVELFAFW